MLDFNQHNCNENTVTTINDFNNRHVKMYADTISKVDRFFIASSQYLIADDMGGNTEHEISNPNKDIVNVSPYGLRGFLHDKAIKRHSRYDSIICSFSSCDCFRILAFSFFILVFRIRGLEQEPAAAARAAAAPRIASCWGSSAACIIAICAL